MTFTPRVAPSAGVPQVGGFTYRNNLVEPERLQPTLAERIDASSMLPGGEDEAAEAGLDDPMVRADTGSQPLRERLNEFRRRLVIEDAPRRWWQPKNR